MTTTQQKKKKMERELTKLWKKVCYKKYPHKCEVCGEKLSTFHHFIPKGRCLAMKFDVKNGVPLCRKCHYKVHFSHKPTEVAKIVNAIRKSRGKKWCDYIDTNERKTVRKNLGWLREQKEKLL